MVWLFVVHSKTHVSEVLRYECTYMYYVEFTPSITMHTRIILLISWFLARMCFKENSPKSFAKALNGKHGSQAHASFLLLCRMSTRIQLPSDDCKFVTKLLGENTRVLYSNTHRRWEQFSKLHTFEMSIREIFLVKSRQPQVPFLTSK